MDPDGITIHLTSFNLDNKKMDPSNTFIQRKDSINSVSSVSEVDERRFRVSRNQNSILPTHDIPHSVHTTHTTGTMIDNRSVGSEETVSFCNASEKCTLSRDCSVESVFRDVQWNLGSTNNSIDLFSTQSFNKSNFQKVISHSFDDDDDDETTIYLCEEGSYSIDESDSLVRFVASPASNLLLQNKDDNKGDTNRKFDFNPPTNNMKLRNHLLNSIKIKSFVIGILLGLLMQFSTLGANFLASTCKVTGTTVKGGHHYESMMFPHVSEWNFLWSAFTSGLGLAVMLLLRVIVAGIDSKQNPVLIYMEGFVSVGALVGICVAWIMVDYVLKVNGHLVLSLVTLGGSLVWYKVLAVLQLRRVKTDTTRSDMKEPLLPHFKEQITDLDVATSLPRVNVLGTTLGFVVGVFIQFSSLGANFILQIIRNMHNEEQISQSFLSVSIYYLSKATNENRERLVLICFVWSFLTSLIGIVLLLALRFVVSNIILIANLDKTSVPTFIAKSQDKLIVQLECFYAFGTVLGLNTAWACTDYILGLDSHISQSICALVATIIWCILVLYSTRSRVV
jgi:hypothetical protein